MKLENDLGKDSITKLVFRLAIPAMLAQFVNVLYGIVDRIYIGNMSGIGDIALAGVGVCAPIATFISSFAFLVGMGGAPLFAMSLGEKKLENAKKILSNSAMMLIVLSIILTIAVLLLKRPLLMSFGSSQATYPYADEYLTFYTMGTIFSIVSLGLNQFIIAQGFSKMGMMTVFMGAVINIILDPLFIFVFHMDVAGAAIATVISQFASCLFVVLFLLSQRVRVKLTFGGYAKNIMIKIMKLGFSPFLIMATDSLIIIALNSVLQHYGGVTSGDQWVTIATIVQSFMQLVTMPMLGISGGTQPILSYNYGAKKIDRIYQAEKVITFLCLGFTTTMFLVSFLIAPTFTRIFTNHQEILHNSIWGIRVYMIGIIPLALQYAFVDGFTALGQAKYAICLSLFRKLGVLFTGTLVLPYLFGVSAAFYAEPLADIVSAITSTTIFLIFIPKILNRRQQATGDIDLLFQ